MDENLVTHYVCVIARFFLENIRRVLILFIDEENGLLSIRRFVEMLRDDEAFGEIMEQGLNELVYGNEETRRMMRERLNKFLVHLLRFGSRQNPDTVQLASLREVLNYIRKRGRDAEEHLIKQQARMNLESLEHFYESISVPRYEEPFVPEPVSRQNRMEMTLNTSGTKTGPRRVINKKEERRKSPERTNATMSRSLRPVQSYSRPLPSHPGTVEWRTASSNQHSCSNQPSKSRRESPPRRSFSNKASKFPSTSSQLPYDNELEYSSMEEASDSEMMSKEEEQRSEMIRRMFNSTVERNTGKVESARTSHRRIATTTSVTEKRPATVSSREQLSSTSSSDNSSESHIETILKSINKQCLAQSRIKTPTSPNNKNGPFSSDLLQKLGISSDGNQETRPTKTVESKSSSKSLNPFAKEFVPRNSTQSSSFSISDSRLPSEVASLDQRAPQFAQQYYEPINHVNNHGLPTNSVQYEAQNQSVNLPTDKSDVSYVLQEDPANIDITQCQICKARVYLYHEKVRCYPCGSMFHAKCKTNNLEIVSPCSRCREKKNLESPESD